MTDLIQQAEALEALAAECADAIKRTAASAESYRAEAAKLREQAAREPLRCVVVFTPHRRPISAHAADEGFITAFDNIAVPMVEVRPVRITDEHESQAWKAYHEACRSDARPWRVVMEYALSLAGVEVEK
jgi:hypothetical protein